MSLQSRIDSIIARKANALTDAGWELYTEAKNLVAVRTGKLQSDLVSVTKPVQGGVYKVEVGTINNPYAKFVEYGVQGRTYNYSRGGRVVYSGVGQKYLRRAFENKRNQIFSKINNA
jgi:hypothetical protein